MSRVTTAASKAKKGDRVKYPGIVAAAAKLGTTRQHLWAVLKGNRSSRRLMQRYQELKGRTE